MSDQITTVGKLREVFVHLSDETELYAQVVAQDGTVCMARLTGGIIPGSSPTKAVLGMRHSLLKSLVVEDIDQALKTD